LRALKLSLGACWNFFEQGPPFHFTFYCKSEMPCLNKSPVLSAQENRLFLRRGCYQRH
jgi:hypothetical protein